MPNKSTRLIEGRDYTVSCGNIFADMGMPDADEMLIRAQCVHEIGKAIRAKKLSQAAAAKKLGIHQPDLSRLLGGQLRRYSLGRLLQFLIALDQEVTITVRNKKEKSKRVNFELAAE